MKPQVLVVEDDEPLRYAMCRILEYGGFGTIEAESGVDAVRMLDLVPNVVLLDLALPMLSGEEVLKVIRERGLHTRVVIFTGMEGDRVDRAKALNPDIILKKPSFQECLWAACSGADQATVDQMTCKMLKGR